MQLESDFKSKAAESILDKAETELVGKQGNPVYEAVQRVHDRLRAYGQEFGYDVEPLIDSFGGVDVQRSEGTLTIRWGWDHPAIEYFEWGTSDHTVDGDPVLSFVWSRDEAPDWVAEEFEEEGDGYRVFLPEVEVAGIEETRAIRDSLTWLRGELRS